MWKQFPSKKKLVVEALLGNSAILASDIAWTCDKSVSNFK